MFNRISYIGNFFCFESTVALFGSIFSYHMTKKLSVGIQSHIQKQPSRGHGGIFKIFKKIPPATLLKERLWHTCFPVNFDTSGGCFFKGSSQKLTLNS